MCHVHSLFDIETAISLDSEVKLTWDKKRNGEMYCYSGRKRQT